ncbi:hypothetical protein AAHA92_09516 [Salvia divinorum]|uniref:Uncharacterized protein n=1 Tax=Salvia divinorum TaxID=28513 RepID=A0ABD1HRR7_SALDI
MIELVRKKFKHQYSLYAVAIQRNWNLLLIFIIAAHLDLKTNLFIHEGDVVYLTLPASSPLILVPSSFLILCFAFLLAVLEHLGSSPKWFLQISTSNDQKVRRSKQLAVSSNRDPEVLGIMVILHTQSMEIVLHKKVCLQRHSIITLKGMERMNIGND